MKYFQIVNLSFLLLFFISACTNAPEIENLAKNNDVLIGTISSQLNNWNLSSNVTVEGDELTITYTDEQPFYLDSISNELVAELLILKNYTILDSFDVDLIVFSFNGFQETLSYKFGKVIKEQLKAKYPNTIYNNCVLKSLEKLSPQKMITIRSTMNWLRAEANLFQYCDNYWQALDEFVRYRQTGNIEYLDDATSFVVLTGYFKMTGKELENAPNYKDFEPIWDLTMTSSEVLNAGTFKEMKVKLESLSLVS